MKRNKNEINESLKILYRSEEKTIKVGRIEKKKRVVKILGIKSILQERRIYKAKHGRETINLHCGEKGGVIGFDGKPIPYCCHFHKLERQPDFAAQKSALQEIVEDKGHTFELYPKFHCETNWIERYWGAAKRRARRECDYSFKSLLKNLDTYLNGVNLNSVSNFTFVYNKILIK
jgi:hypothetical protein